MKRKYIFLTILSSSLILFSLTFFNGCSSSKYMISSWQKQEIKIDGNPSEWLPVIQQIPDKKISVAFKNDDKYLYLCLMTDDRAKIFQLLRAGFIVWFETKNSDYKTYGVRYPLPVDYTDQPQSSTMNRENVQKENAPRENLKKMIETFFQKQNELEIVNKDKFPLTAVTLPNKEGIEAKFGEFRGMLTYELKVPLAVEGDYSFKVGALPGDKIVIRFETETAEIGRTKGDSEESGSRGGTSGGGMRGGGMRGGGMRGGGGRGGGMSGSSGGSIDYSIELKLASAETTK